jgi:ERCC4-type nuclease
VKQDGYLILFILTSTLIVIIVSFVAFDVIRTRRQRTAARFVFDMARKRREEASEKPDPEVSDQVDMLILRTIIRQQFSKRYQLTNTLR